MQGPFYIGYDASGKKLEQGVILADLTPAQLRRAPGGVAGLSARGESRGDLPPGGRIGPGVIVRSVAAGHILAGLRAVE